MPTVPETLVLPNLFRCAVPLVIQDAEKFFKTEDASVTGPEVNFYPVAGGPAKFTWALRATNDETTVDFYLMMRANIDIEVEMECHLRTQSPSGIIVHRYKYDRVYENRALEKDQWDELCLLCLDFPSIEKNQLVDGNLYIHVDVCCELRNRVLPESDTLMIDMTSIAEQFRDRIHSDFTLVGADGHQVKTHKLVLESASPVFKTMFATDCSETREGLCTIPDFDEKSIAAMLACILGADISEWDFEIQARIFKLADKYAILQLKKKCADHLAGNMTLERVVDALMLADQHSAPDLKAAGFTFMENNWKKVIANNVVDVLRLASPALYEEWQQRLDPPEIGEASRKRAAEESSSESQSKKNPKG